MFPFKRTEACLRVRGCALVSGVGHQVLSRWRSLHISLGYGAQLAGSSAGNRRQREARLRQVLQDGEDLGLLLIAHFRRGTSDVDEWYPLTACLSIFILDLSNHKQIFHLYDMFLILLCLHHLQKALDSLPSLASNSWWVALIFWNPQFYCTFNI